MVLENKIIDEEIQIRRGIFQGDSLSPLLFCICLIPLTTELNNYKAGYSLQNHCINHLVYMDDLKLFAQNEQQFTDLMKIVKQFKFSDDINMRFGVEKCAKITIKKGKLEHSENLKLDDEVTIKSLEPDRTYRYLGIEENIDVE